MRSTSQRRNVDSHGCAAGCSFRATLSLASFVRMAMSMARSFADACWTLLRIRLLLLLAVRKDFLGHLALHALLVLLVPQGVDLVIERNDGSLTALGNRRPSGSEAA